MGGPTANFRAPACAKQTKAGACPHQRCLFPEPCERLEADHVDYLKLLERLRKLPGVKKVFVRSGIRFDYVLADRKHGDEFIYELCENHVSGQLKVAPEHVSDTVLAHMGKPPRAVYERFVQKYEQANEELGKRQYLVPYLMSSHPGSTLDEAVELAEYVRDLGYMPEQVQDFYPTPSTMSTVMYATGVDPHTMQPVYVPKSPHEKALQRALIQYRDSKNRPLVLEALKKAGRMDLVGHGRECLVRPEGAPPAKGPRGKASGSATLRKAASKADPARKGSGKGGGKGEGARKGKGKGAGRGEPTRKDGGKPSAKQPAGRDAADRSSRPSSPHKAAKGSPKRPGASSPKSGRAKGGRGPRRP